MENFKQRILSGWTFTRILYLGIGITLIIDSAKSQQWFAVLFGVYFSSMGLFAFGCASGNCFNGNSKTTNSTNITPVSEIEFEELKTK